LSGGRERAFTVKGGDAEMTEKEGRSAKKKCGKKRGREKKARMPS